MPRFSGNARRYRHQVSGFQPRPLEHVARDHVLATLYYFNGNRSKAAKELRIAYRTLRNYLDRYKADGHIVPPVNCWGIEAD